MSFRFITSVLTVGALVATLSAAPARANSDDLGRAIGAAATLFIIGKIIESEHRKKKHETATAHQPKPKPKAQHKHQPAPQTHARHGQIGKPYFQDRNHNRTVVTPRHDGRHGGHGTGYRRAPLPNQCLIPVSGGGTRYVMGRRCLERNYQSARPLPQNCLITLRGARHDRPVYSVRCLRHQGYQVAGF